MTESLRTEVGSSEWNPMQKCVKSKSKLMADYFKENIWQTFWKQILWKCRILFNRQHKLERRTMNNNIDMTGKEHLLELWSERKNMQQVIHELIQNSETGVVAYDRFYKELETRYNTSFPKNNEDMILKGILDNVLWNMVGNKELCEHITENGKLYCYPECDTQMTEDNAA